MCIAQGGAFCLSEWGVLITMSYVFEQSIFYFGAFLKCKISRLFMKVGKNQQNFLNTVFSLERNEIVSVLLKLLNQ